jgi:hypothetical protein
VGEELSCDVDEWSVARQLDLSSLLVELVGCNTKVGVEADVIRIGCLSPMIHPEDVWPEEILESLTE